MSDEKDVKDLEGKESSDLSKDDTKDTTSADSLNADKGDDSGNEQSVPYSRFKKINDEYKELKAEVELHKAGIAISKEASKDPVFMKAINDLIKQKNEGQLTKEEFRESVDEAKEDSKERSKDVDEIKMALREDIAYRYIDKFKSMAKDDEYTEKEDLDLLEDLTTKELLKINQDPYKRYSSTDITEAYNKAKKRLDSFNDRKTAKYVKEKRADYVPSSKAGASVKKDVIFNSRSEESNYISQALKGKKFDDE